MKILGDTTLKQRTVTVTVGKDEDGKPVELIMRPIKFGKLMEIERDIPEPLAPSTGMKKKDPKTGQFLKRNGQFVMLRDTEDKAYKLDLQNREIAVNCATVVHSLGDQITELPVQTAEQTAQVYWMSVLDKLTDVGIDQGIFHMLVAAAVRLSKPLTNLDLILMRQELGTDQETDEITEEKEAELIEALEEVKASGKA